tara:strand:- start:88 stop:465 length:378 start_codon:yes stop_codon:yes gene_type:complete
MNKISSNKSFGIVFFIVLLLLALWPLTKGENINFWFLFFSTIFLILGIMNSKLLTPLNKVWGKFGEILGKIVSPIILAVVFFGIVTPIGLLLRLFRKDVLNLKLNNKSSYWLKREKDMNQMDKQF